MILSMEAPSCEISLISLICSIIILLSLIKLTSFLTWFPKIYLFGYLFWSNFNIDIDISLITNKLAIKLTNIF